VIESAPLGPSRRRYANAAAIVATSAGPLDVLDTLQAIEDRFGRTRRGARWQARVLDLDIVLWSGGGWDDGRLTIPHREFRRRRFVVAPAATIARAWRDPSTGLAIAHLQARLTRAKPLA
jgi:2-amino-4-hydroxy-6-hydroxymethyldihydropteridine diphosphokinase